MYDVDNNIKTSGQNVSSSDHSMHSTDPDQILDEPELDTKHPCVINKDTHKILTKALNDPLDTPKAKYTRQCILSEDPIISSVSEKNEDCNVLDDSINAFDLDKSTQKSFQALNASSKLTEMQKSGKGSIILEKQFNTTEVDDTTNLGNIVNLPEIEKDTQKNTMASGNTVSCLGLEKVENNYNTMSDITLNPSELEKNNAALSDNTVGLAQYNSVTTSNTVNSPDLDNNAEISYTISSDSIVNSPELEIYSEKNSTSTLADSVNSPDLVNDTEKYVNITTNKNTATMLELEKTVQIDLMKSVGRPKGMMEIKKKEVLANSKMKILSAQKRKLAKTTLGIKASKNPQNFSKEKSTRKIPRPSKPSNDNLKKVMQKPSNLFMTKKYKDSLMNFYSSPSDSRPCKVFIVPIEYPKEYLSSQDMKELSSILSKINDETKIHECIGPKFSDFDYRNGGYLVTCRGVASKDWLTNIIPEINLSNGIPLVAVEPDILSKTANIYGLFSGSISQTRQLFHRLIIQNVQIGALIREWVLLSTEVAPGGFYARFRIPKIHLDELRKLDYSLFYELGSVKLALLDSEEREKPEYIEVAMKNKKETKNISSSNTFHRKTGPLEQSQYYRGTMGSNCMKDQIYNDSHCLKDRRYEENERERVSRSPIINEGSYPDRSYSNSQFRQERKVDRGEREHIPRKQSTRISKYLGESSMSVERNIDSDTDETNQSWKQHQSERESYLWKYRRSRDEMDYMAPGKFINPSLGMRAIEQDSYICKERPQLKQKQIYRDSIAREAMRIDHEDPELVSRMGPVTYLNDEKHANRSRVVKESWGLNQRLSNSHNSRERFFEERNREQLQGINSFDSCWNSGEEGEEKFHSWQDDQLYRKCSNSRSRRTEDNERDQMQRVKSGGSDSDRQKDNILEYNSYRTEKDPLESREKYLFQTDFHSWRETSDIDERKQMLRLHSAKDQDHREYNSYRTEKDPLESWEKDFSQTDFHSSRETSDIDERKRMLRLHSAKDQDHREYNSYRTEKDPLESWEKDFFQTNFHSLRETSDIDERKRMLRLHSAKDQDHREYNSYRTEKDPLESWEKDFFQTNFHSLRETSDIDEKKQMLKLHSTKDRDQIYGEPHSSTEGRPEEGKRKHLQRMNSLIPECDPYNEKALHHNFYRAAEGSKQFQTQDQIYIDPYFSREDSSEEDEGVQLQRINSIRDQGRNKELASNLNFPKFQKQNQILMGPHSLREGIYREGENAQMQRMTYASHRSSPNKEEAQNQNFHKASREHDPIYVLPHSLREAEYVKGDHLHLQRMNSVAYGWEPNKTDAQNQNLHKSATAKKQFQEQEQINIEPYQVQGTNSFGLCHDHNITLEHVYRATPNPQLHVMQNQVCMDPRYMSGIMNLEGKWVQVPMNPAFYLKNDTSIQPNFYNMTTKPNPVQLYEPLQESSHNWRKVIQKEAPEINSIDSSSLSMPDSKTECITSMYVGENLLTNPPSHTTETPVRDKAMLISSQPEIRTKAICGFFPGSPGLTPELLLTRLRRQNSSAAVEKWTVIKLNPEKNGSFAIIKIPETSLDVLLAWDNKLYYNLERITVQLSNDNLSDEKMSSKNEQGNIFLNNRCSPISRNTGKPTGRGPRHEFRDNRRPRPTNRGGRPIQKSNKGGRKIIPRKRLRDKRSPDDRNKKKPRESRSPLGRRESSPRRISRDRRKERDVSSEERRSWDARNRKF